MTFGTLQNAATSMHVDTPLSFPQPDFPQDSAMFCGTREILNNGLLASTPPPASPAAAPQPPCAPKQRGGQPQFFTFSGHHEALSRNRKLVIGSVEEKRGRE
jgi:hypothetical protein